MKTINLLLSIGIISLLFITSCKKDEPENPTIPNEEEVITTLIYTLTPDSSGAPVIFSFQDLDGDGGNAPVITEGTLSAGTTYNGSLQLLNELSNPVDDITIEIEAEAEDHQFFFPTTVSDINLSYNDLDSNGHPIGLATILATNGNNTGTLTIILRHEPNKSASGVSDGDITNAGGETDIEVTFNVEIK